MDSFSLDSRVYFGTNSPKFNDGVSLNPGLKSMGKSGVSSSSSSSLILDSLKGELVRVPPNLKQKGVSEEKSLAALKSHSEAERRRRERINSHLDTLRSLVPCTDKMDKASLLAEVINEVKELKRAAAEAIKGFVIPMDFDEVRVEPNEDRPFSIKVSVCCEDRPDMLPNIRAALEACKLEIMRVDISTFDGRMKNVFIMKSFKEENWDDTEVCRLLISSVHKALRSVLDKFPTTSDVSPIMLLPNKKRRILLFDTSSSSS